MHISASRSIRTTGGTYGYLALRIHLPAFWPFFSPSGVHQNTPPNHGVLQNSGHQGSHIPRRSLDYASGQAGCVRNGTGHTGRIGIPGKLPKIPTSSFPDNSVCRLHSGLSSKTAESPTREGISDQVAGQIPLGKRQSECKETRTDTRENVSSNLGCTTSPSPLQGASGTGH